MYGKKLLPSFVLAAGVLLLLLLLHRSPQVEAQMTGTVFPASEFVWGTYMPTYATCYTNTVNRIAFSVVPVSQLFSFTPTAAQGTVRYIRVWTDNLIPFYAAVTAGGVGTANPTVTSVQATSLHGGFLYVNIRILCA